MPQLSLVNGHLHDPVEFVACYRSNPLDPEAPGELTISARNVSGQMVDHVFARIPSDVTHECVVDAMRAGWEAWLFGGPSDMRQAVAHVVKRWKLYSKLR